MYLKLKALCNIFLTFLPNKYYKITSSVIFMLQELEEIHIDLANTLNGAIESHALLLLTKVDKQ